VKVLLDVNVLADLFLKREEWLTDAVAIWEANRTGRIQCCALASNIDTLAYLVRRNRAEDALAERDAVRVCLEALEMWSRAITLPEVTPVVLLGEATFHQFHGGTMTNAPDRTNRWQSLCADYESIRGHSWRWPTTPLRFWGTFWHSPPPGELVRRGGAWHGLTRRLRRGLNSVARARWLRRRSAKDTEAGGRPNSAGVATYVQPDGATR